MRCTRCDAELIPGKRFCHACGARAALQCQSCGAAVSSDFRFCPDCGQPIDAADIRAATPSPAADAFARLTRHIPEALARKIRAAQGTIEGERKQVTVLFCDLAGSTAIAERLDPEQYHDLLEQYLELAFREIYRIEGVVNQVAGDGIMALFGAPVAHEDAPQRAIRAALRIRDALAALNEQRLARHGVELHARIGIHTGPVVVGTLGNDLKMDYTAIGDTTNLASRLESLATPGTILVSEATLRLVRGFFHVRPAGPLAVKGKSEPVTAYEILDESSEATPMAIAAERGLTPLVGRDEELRQLEACFERLEGKFAQVVAVVGDAGLGKSRLVYEFKRSLAGAGVVFFEGRCSSLGQEVPFSLFLGMLDRHFGILPGDAPEVACEKVRARLGKDADHIQRYYPALSRLLGLNAGSDEPAPEDITRESFEAVTRLVLAAAEHGPAIMVLEDLHWIDDPSRELLENLAARLASARAMVLVTHRPDDRVAWRARGAFTQLILPRLSDEHVRTIVRAVAGGALPAELERLLIAKAEGSPFCAEEITRSLVEEGYLASNGGGPRLTRPVEEIRIPGTVQEVIAARLDRIGPQAKRVVQVASVLGRQFHRQQLALLLDGEGIDLSRELAALERRGIFHRKALLASDEYRFGESLTQEVAYEGLLLKQRRQLHERIAAALEVGSGDGSAERTALLAHHYARSENRPKAIQALLQAGLETERLPSYRTAVDFYRRAWELAEAELAESGDPAWRRPVLDAAAGIARLAALFGATSLADAQPAARRGRELAQALDDPETLAGLSYFQGAIIMQGDPEHFADGLALAEEGLAVAERRGLKLAAMRLARGLAMSYAYDGRFELARRAIQWSADEVARRGDPVLSDLNMSTRWVHDAVFFLSDDLDTAFADATASYDLARRAPNRTVTSGSAITLASICFLRAEYAEARRWAEESLAIAEEITNAAAFPGAAAVALAARVELREVGNVDRYLELIEQGLHVGSAVQMHVRFLADALRAVDDPAVVARFAEQIAACPAGGRLRQASAHAVLGRLWARLGHHDEAERAFARALATAQGIGARSVLAEAALGAAELATERGDRAAAARHLEQTVALSQELRLNHYLGRAARLVGPAEVGAPDQA